MHTSSADTAYRERDGEERPRIYRNKAGLSASKQQIVAPVRVVVTAQTAALIGAITECARAPACITAL